MRQLLLVGCLLLPALTLSAQGDFDLDKTTSGTLGSTLSLQVHNAPANRLFAVAISYFAGPTPLALLDPADSRSLDVGLDLASSWYVLGTDPAGSATIPTALPNVAAFAGQVLHWQCATFPGTTTVIDQISNAVLTQLGMPAVSAPLPNALLSVRAGATLCWDRTRDAGQGDFLLVSGATTERFGFRSLGSVAGPSMVTPRALHATATLNDGRVLFAGGVDGTGVVTTACEIYDPVADTFTAVANLLGPRAGHAAATLPDGRVMVVGGTTNFTDLTTAITGVLNTVELYDPITNSWAAGPVIGGRRLLPGLTRLNTGRMMVSGGIDVTVLFGFPVAVTSTNKAQLYNPATNSWSNAANMPSGRAYHQDNQLTLADGRVMLSGGVLVPDLVNAANAASIANADLYNPATNTWTGTTMSRARTAHSAVQLASGRVIVCGGSEGLLSAPTAIDAVASFDPATNAWTDLAPLMTARAGHAAALLPDGLLVLLGGSGDTSGEALHF
jgi:N-acetylneuraminic acid mutarotase